MKPMYDREADFDLSRDATLLVSAIVTAAERDETMAYCLLEWGISVCFELGLDPAACLQKARDDLMFNIEQGLDSPSEDQGKIH